MKLFKKKEEPSKEKPSYCDTEHIGYGWCQNTLTVHGERDELVSFVSDVESRKNGTVNVFDLNKVFPLEHETKMLDCWGCLSDFRDTKLTDTIHSLIYKFGTRHGTPKKAVEYIAKKYPHLVFSLDYWICEVAFGTLVVKGSDIILKCSGNLDSWNED